MNKTELFSLLKTHDLYPILVESVPSDKNSDLNSAYIMAGALEDFINSAKAMNEKIVIIYAMVLEEEDFIYDGNLESLDGNEDVNKSISESLDLSTVIPKLRDYKKYLGKEGFFELSLFYKDNIFKFFHQERWWGEFQELKDAAVDIITEQEEIRQENLKKINSQRQSELISRIRDLIKDKDFARFSSRKDSTQRAMQTYAMEAIPELQELDSETLKSEIKALSDKIKAYKTLNKFS
jgi:hypothetical protein